MSNPQTRANMLLPSARAAASLHLPRMPDYIANHIIRNATISATDTDTMCTICQQNFTSDPASDSDSSSPASDSDADQDFSIVRIPPCNHAFHAHCITSWLASTAPTRNACPTCRTPLCRLNVLSAAAATALRADMIVVPDPHWSAAHYTSILTFVDAQVAAQPVNGLDPDFVSIPRLTRNWWVARGHAVVAVEHVMIGARWVEMLAAQRVKEWVDERGEQGGWAGQVFYGMFLVLESMFAQMYSPERLTALAGEASDAEGSDGSGDTEEDDEEDMTPGQRLFTATMLARYGHLSPESFARQELWELEGELDSLPSLSSTPGPLFGDRGAEVANLPGLPTRPDGGRLPTDGGATGHSFQGSPTLPSTEGNTPHQPISFENAHPAPEDIQSKATDPDNTTFATYYSSTLNPSVPSSRPNQWKKPHTFAPEPESTEEKLSDEWYLVMLVRRRVAEVARSKQDNRVEE
ncbi:hypothetical protein BDU57DRAFT_568857 [Ampelomyces quisqualis]|uniref:RING-type domain-containing protein n=1 Tax=Ampelomyces quisqualis TaxID=50730 RepID=A0A6A5QV51_AMPQU|nr:hypothetical protein BDU57DRAFT_568857 [Ampelomyces quisqualis]